MKKDTRLWHGGVPGLKVGDMLYPGYKRATHAGCAFCEARSKGETLAGVDPPSAQHAVYITSDKEYARHYASLYGYGDLYTVEPMAAMVPSAEDHFPTWAVPSAVVVGVYQRAVRLTWSQRRALFRAWTAADAAVELRNASHLPKEGE